jgi:hypothetical protein
MEPCVPLFTKSDFAGAASTRVHCPAKLFEAASDRMLGGVKKSTFLPAETE